MIRALIYDLDNTLYPVHEISDQVFAEVYKLMDENTSGMSQNDIAKAKEEITHIPMQKTADKYGFDEEFKQQASDILANTAYDKPFYPYDDYRYVKQAQADKYLVTNGAIKLQSSKIKMLGIEPDFKKVYIVDPSSTDKTKKDIFEEIIKAHDYKKDEVLVIGDDPESEIQAGKDIGLKTVLYDPEHKNTTADTADYVINNHQEILQLL